MNTKLNFLAAGIFLAALGTGFGQNALQISTNYFPVIEKAGPASLTVQRAGDTNAEVSADFATNDLAFTNGPSNPQLGGAGKEWTVSQFQGAAGEAVSSPLSSQVGTEAGDKPAVIYGSGLELRVATPVNVVRSKKYPGIEYSGILVQAAQSNPLQLINPFAPAKYGNGEANVVRHFLTGEVEGLKLWRISF
jgi:hypothetical protein